MEKWREAKTTAVTSFEAEVKINFDSVKINVNCITVLKRCM